MIIEKAQELGLALSESAEFHRMMAAKEAVDKHGRIQDMMRDYTQKREDILRLMEGDEADKGEMMDLSRQLDEIQSALVSHPVFMEMMEAQGFQALMQQANRTIAACIGLDDPDAEGEQAGECGGSCASCSGCKH